MRAHIEALPRSVGSDAIDDRVDQHQSLLQLSAREATTGFDRGDQSLCILDLLEYTVERFDHVALSRCLKTNWDVDVRCALDGGTAWVPVGGRAVVDYRDASAHFRLTATAATFAEILRDSRYVRGLELGDLLDEADEIADILSRDDSVRELADLIALADRLMGRR